MFAQPQLLLHRKATARPSNPVHWIHASSGIEAMRYLVSLENLPYDPSVHSGVFLRFAGILKAQTVIGATEIHW